MGTITKIILENPYRVLGVYANSPKKDIVANKGKASAFLKVNKPVEYPLDLKGILPALNRTLDLMNEAEAHLTIAKEQIKYAQFWFLQKMSPLDDIAFNRLLAGNMAGAIEIWSKQDTLSSLQNKMVCFLIDDKTRAAVLVAENLYDKFGDEYINKVDTSCTLKMTGIELLHLFLESLGDEIGYQKIIGYVTNVEAKTFIRSKAVSPLINKISLEVDKTKNVDHKDPKARIEAARKLVANTKEAFSQLKRILPATDSQYQMIADKLGLEILQCGIDYFNNSEDDDAPHTAMTMQKYAQSVVVGSLAKQRCDENVKILQKILGEMPPKEVMAEDKAIKAELNKFVNYADKITVAITLLNRVKPHMLCLKQKLGATNDYYLKISTLVVKVALHKVVEEVNDTQNDPQIADNLRLGLGLVTNSIETLKMVLRQAWNATIIMDEFDLEVDFKSHYAQNRNTLKSICNDFGISTYVSKPTTSLQPIPNLKPTTSTSTTRSTAQPQPIPNLKPTTSTSTTESTAQPRPSTAYTPTSNKNTNKYLKPIIIVVIIHIIWGLIVAFNGLNFFIGVFEGIFGWLFGINFIAYWIIAWFYEEITE